MIPSGRQTDDQGRHDEEDGHEHPPEHEVTAGLEHPALLSRRDVQFAIERATAAVAHAGAIIQRRAGQGSRSPRPRSLPERLARSEARFRALVSVTGHVMWSTDPEGRIVEGQPAWKAFTGQSTLELYAGGGYGWTEALHPDDREETLARFRDAVAQGAFFQHQVRVRQQREDESQWRDTFMRAAPVRDPSGEIVEWVIVNSDVTEFARARAEAEEAERAARHDAERARDAAEAAWHEAEAATAAKARVLAASSHDLRTPIGAVTGYVSLLQAEVLGPITDAQRETLARIGVAGNHLLSLVTDILEAAVTESGSMRFHIERLALRELCTGLETLTSHTAQDKGVRLTCTVVPPDQADRAFVLADRERLLQILVNLVTNAVKFTPAGGDVTVELSVSGETAVLSVRDTGCGIAPGNHARIFEPFVRLAPPAGAEGIGTAAHRRGPQCDPREEPAPGPTGERGIGLGLATSRELARSMGGDITVASEVGAGSTFTVTLPAAT